MTAASLFSRAASFDHAISKRFFHLYGGQRTTGGRGVLKMFERAGQGYLWFGLPAAVLLLSHDAAAREDAQTLLLAMVLDLVVIAVLKACAQRQCPLRTSLLLRPGRAAPTATAVHGARHAYY
jgi:membrane-associated PAP2 superfamily phosphatase